MMDKTYFSSFNIDKIFPQLDIFNPKNSLQIYNLILILQKTDEVYIRKASIYFVLIFLVSFMSFLQVCFEVIIKGNSIFNLEAEFVAYAIYDLLVFF